MTVVISPARLQHRGTPIENKSRNDPRSTSDMKIAQHKQPKKKKRNKGNPRQQKPCADSRVSLCACAPMYNRHLPSATDIISKCTRVVKKQNKKEELKIKSVLPPCTCVTKKHVNHSMKRSVWLPSMMHYTTITS